MLHRLVRGQKISKSKIITLLTVVFLIIGVSVYVITTEIFTTKSVDCAKLINTATSLLQHKNYNEAYSGLKPYLDKCTTLTMKASASQNKEHSTTPAQAIKYYSAITNAAYANGDAQHEIQYSKQAITFNKTLTPEEQQKIPNLQKTMLQLWDIQIQATVQLQKSNTK